MPSVEFGPVTPAKEKPQTYSLNGTATGISTYMLKNLKFNLRSSFIDIYNIKLYLINDIY
jgi:hypothetical protein